MTTTQITGALMEVGAPIVMRYVTKSAAKARFSKTDPTANPADAEDERAFLERIRLEADLPEYSLFEEFTEMVVQVCVSPLMSFLLWNRKGS
jgi:anoctamin-10